MIAEFRLSDEAPTRPPYVPVGRESRRTMPKELLRCNIITVVFLQENKISPDAAASGLYLSV